MGTAPPERSRPGHGHEDGGAHGQPERRSLPQGPLQPGREQERHQPAESTDEGTHGHFASEDFGLPVLLHFAGGKAAHQNGGRLHPHVACKANDQRQVAKDGLVDGRLCTRSHELPQ